MAEENLGTAVLKIVVDDDQARTALKLLKRDVESAGISKSTTSSSSRQTKSERDLEVIKEKRFRLARRIEALEDKGVNVSRLRTQLGRLTTAYAERDFTLARNTARELARQATLAERTEKRRARAARNAKAEADESIRSARGLNRVNIDGSLRDVGSPRFVTRGARQGGQAESINALTAAQKRRYSLERQISSLEAAGVNTAKLRAQLGEATTAQANRQFGSFNRIADALSLTLLKERDKLKVIRDQNRELDKQAKQGGPREPLRGRVGLTGSPADTAFLARQGGPRLPLGGAANIPGSPAFLDAIFPKAARRQFEEAAKEIRQAASAPAREAILERRAQQRSLQTAGGGGLTSFLRDVREREKAEKRITTERAKGYKQAQFAERTLTAFATKRADLLKAADGAGAKGGRLGGAISSGIIGGAFPLLFGQGGGAAAGGLIGGIAGGAFGGGGGFAGSLVGTLVGQQLDVFNQLAKALQDPVANFKQLVEASNLSSKGLENYVQTLIDLGQTAEAESLIRRDISRTIDPTTLAITNAANEQYARTLADVQERLGAILAGPASNFINWLDEIIRRSGLLPGAGQGPATAEAQNRLGLANRGAGTALGLGGIGIAALGVAAALFTGGASLLPAAIAGGGLAAAGAFQTQVGASLQDQAASAELLKGVQQEILAVEQKRIAAQQQLVNLTQQNAPGQKELAFQISLLDIEDKLKKAKADFNARDASTESFQAYKLELDSLKLVEKQLRANEALRLQNLRAQKQLDTDLTSIKLQGINEQIAATQALGQAERGVARNTLATVQTIQAGIDAAKRREQEIGAQITAARQQGDEQGAARLVNEQKVAATETKLKLVEGAQALKDAGAQLVKDAQETTRNLQSLRESNLRFQTPQERQRTIDQLNAEVQAEVNRRNVRVTFRGTPEQILSEKRAFVEFGRKEQEYIQQAAAIQDAIVTANQGLININNELVTTNNNNIAATDKLTAQVYELTQKDWHVYINNNYTGSTAKELLAAATLP